MPSAWPRGTIVALCIGSVAATNHKQKTKLENSPSHNETQQANTANLPQFRKTGL